MSKQKKVTVLIITLYYQHYTAHAVKYVFRNITVNLKDHIWYILNEDKLPSLGEP